MKTLVSRFVKDESGATAIEYGLIAAGISVAIIAVVQGLGPKLDGDVHEGFERAQLNRVRLSWRRLRRFRSLLLFGRPRSFAEQLSENRRVSFYMTFWSAG